MQEENDCRFVDELRSRVVDGVRQGVADHFHCCANHPWETWRKRGCPVSVRQADAAWAAAYPAALRDAADRLPERTEGTNGEGTAAWPERHREVYSLAIEEAQGALRRLADASEDGVA